ncbi:MAG: anthranilate phosphoribosyltransferase [Kangiellaceae bacterium]|jgi:anthranilate phosphoribosyltransferase|nr:anthranilate phosphoribosyltransferase [Kangiellaceae bacterium]
MSSVMERLYLGEDLSFGDTQSSIQAIIKGQLSEAEIAALLVALKIKGESAEEIAGAASALRQSARPFNKSNAAVADTCGTGGDGMSTINISTMVSLVAAECGVKVAKHGNRSVSSKCGSSDLLESFGIKLDATTANAEHSLEQENFCFLFAPHYHPGVKFVMPVRTALKTRTLFNLIGPLANPASPEIQLMGVYDATLLETMANALHNLGCKKAFVVNGGGLDEIALHTHTDVAYLNNGVVDQITITPQDAGIKPVKLSELQLEQPEEIFAALKSVLRGEGKQAHIDAIAINAAAVLLLADKVTDLKQGAELAYQTIASGKLIERVDRIAEISHAVK